MRDLLSKIINQFTKGVDTYYNNGSMWFIFTDEKKWVIELTKEGTLWYNFYFFQDCFKYLSLDVLENQHYITEWVEDTIQNGIKETHEDVYHNKGRVEGVIKNGIKYVKKRNRQPYGKVGDIVKNGIRETIHGIHFFEDTTENVIKNGIKEVIELPDKSGQLNGYGEYYARQKNMTYPHTDIVNDVITDGIKETNWRKVDNHPTYLDHILINK